MKYSIIGLVIWLIPIKSFSQSEQLIDLIDSLIQHDLNYVLDTNLTSMTKPDPLIMVDGHIITKEKFLENFKMVDIKSFKTLSDSLAFQKFDPNAWGGFILFETNLSKRKLKKKL